MILQRVTCENQCFSTVYRRLSLGSLLALVLLSTFVSLKQPAYAATYDVNAAVHAPSSPQPAVITQPNTGSTVYSSTLVVKGTCPNLTPSLVVVLWRDNTLLGSAVCDLAGRFEVVISLTPGDNLIVPKIRNITNDPGIDGQPVQVTYSETIPPAPQNTATTDSSSQPTQVPTKNSDSQPVLNIAPVEEYLPIKSNGDVSVTIDIKSGNAPFVLSIDWGDGTKNTYKFSTGGKKTLSHTYKTGGNRSVKVDVTDKSGKTVHLVLGAVSSVPASSKYTQQPSKSLFQRLRPYIIAGASIVTIGAVATAAIMSASGNTATALKTPTKSSKTTKKRHKVRNAKK